jgi:S1-C subfamily serine protease
VEVVEVSAQRCDRPNRAHGVGVVVGDDLVVTAAHTVDDDLRDLTVEGGAAGVVVVDARTDLALLRASVDARPVDWADVDAPPLGPALIHLADGAHEVEIVRSGSLIVDDVTDHVRHERVVHTFTPGVDPGASGAPLTTPSGRLLGIVTLDRTDTNEAHATASHELRRLVDQHGASDPAPAPACHD